ncbi:DUF397 domain-containing protein [Streptomyces lanatus]|uniref:DUF397 domain-containing protein n=1 Tax=Streptomyces lanatus TaxID=66900 RepID=A0ABV1XJ96_9ACTN|nr:DUF397 domain-containing protein [Streptomyces lanatus]
MRRLSPEDPGIIVVRDSKAPEKRRLAVSPEAWGAFVSHASR